MYPSQRRRLLFTLSIVLGGMLVAMFAAGYFVEQNALREESASVQRQLRLYAQALQQRIDRYRTLPQILTLDPDLRAAVDAPLSADQVERLNRKLERANNVTQSSTLTLINRDGIALAASNWRGARSNVGVDYAFRPYYQQALASGSGSFYGIGLTTGEPGYFLSQAIRDPAGQVQGVVVIKIALAALEREWLQTPDIVLASDAHDVVFLASRPQWRYRMLAPLSERDRRELQATRQYASQRLLPLQRRVIEPTGSGGVLAEMQMPPWWRCCGRPCRCPRAAGACTCCTTPAPVRPPAARRPSRRPVRGWRWRCCGCSCSSVAGCRPCASAAGMNWKRCCSNTPKNCAPPRMAWWQRRNRPTLA